MLLEDRKLLFCTNNVTLIAQNSEMKAPCAVFNPGVFTVDREAFGNVKGD